MSLLLPALLVVAALLGASLPAITGPGSGARPVRVAIHLLSIIGFGAVGGILARRGDLWDGLGVIGAGFLWTGGFWIVAIRRRLRRGGRPDLREDEGRPQGQGISAGPANERVGGEETVEEQASAEELDPQEQEILRRLLAMGDLRVREIATSRERIIYADRAGGTTEALGRMHHSQHLRIPVVDGSVDRIVGILHAKDLAPSVLEGKQSPALKGLMRRPLFVSGDRTVASLLELFRSQRSHMAIVVDSYSKTIGLITRSDLFRHLSGGDRGRQDG